MGCTPSVDRPATGELTEARAAHGVSITIELDEVANARKKHESVRRTDGSLEEDTDPRHAPSGKELALWKAEMSKMATVIGDVKRLRSKTGSRRDISERDDRDSISFEEFLMYVSRHTGLRTSEDELRKLFDFLDLDGDGSVSSAEFVWGLRHSSALRLIARGAGGRSLAASFEVSESYDYSRSTQEQYAMRKSSGHQLREQVLSAAFRKARMSTDHGYHGVYTKARQEWQDSVLADTCSHGADGGGSPWAIFTAGGMGVGKGYTIRFLADRGVFQYSRVVHIDPDQFKACMPEWDGYVAAAGEDAGKLCHMESCYLADMAQETSLWKGLHVLVDGSLRDGKWYTQVFAKLRSRFPALRIAILYVTADEDTVRARVAERAARTGRDVPEDVWKASLAQVESSVQALEPLADVCATIENPDGAPGLARLTTFGASAVSPPAELHWEHLQERLTGCASHIAWHQRATHVYADRIRRIHDQFGGSKRHKVVDALHHTVDFLLHDKCADGRMRAIEEAHEKSGRTSNSGRESSRLDPPVEGKVGSAPELQ